MVTKDLQTLNLKFDQVMFNSLILTWERNFEVTFGIFSVLVFQVRLAINLKVVLQLAFQMHLNNTITKKIHDAMYKR